MVQLRTEWEVGGWLRVMNLIQKRGAQWGLKRCHQDAAMWCQCCSSAKTSSRLIWMASHWATCPGSRPPARQKSMVDRSLWWNLISLINLHQVKWRCPFGVTFWEGMSKFGKIRLEIRKTAICLQYLLAVGKANEEIKANQN